MGGQARQTADCHHSCTIMRLPITRMARVTVLGVCALSALLHAQNLPLEPIHETGASITGAFEGWFKNSDGTFSLLLGYFNRNTKQEVDLAVGPDNRIEPGG